MANTIGRPINRIDTVTTTTVECNSATATLILAANPNRIFAKVSLDAGLLDVQAFVREYAAITDNNQAGELLVRITSGNDSLFKSLYQTETDNPYTGDLSAIGVGSGLFNLHIMEAVR